MFNYKSKYWKKRSSYFKLFTSYLHAMMISPLKAAKLVWIVFLMTGLLNQEYSCMFFFPLMW